MVVLVLLQTSHRTFSLHEQERFSCKEQKISENFYARGDGTVSLADMNYVPLPFPDWKRHVFLLQKFYLSSFSVSTFSQRAFYFSDEYLTKLFSENGFHTEEHLLCCKQVENRSRDIVMNR